VKTFKDFITEVETLRPINPINSRQLISLDDPQVQRNLRSAMVPSKPVAPVKPKDRIGEFVGRMVRNTLLSPQ